MAADIQIVNAAGVSAQTLAYLGDSVFELFVRSYLIQKGDRPVGMLNKLAKKYVSAAAQANMYNTIFDMLTDEEKSILKRGRNISTHSRAKNADVMEYRHATGIETLFGYLFVNNNFERLNEVFDLCAKTVTEA